MGLHLGAGSPRRWLPLCLALAPAARADSAPPPGSVAAPSAVGAASRDAVVPQLGWARPAAAGDAPRPGAGVGQTLAAGAAAARDAPPPQGGLGRPFTAGTALRGSARPAAGGAAISFTSRGVVRLAAASSGGAAGAGVPGMGVLGWERPARLASGAGPEAPPAGGVTAREPRSLDTRLFRAVNLTPGRRDGADPFFQALMPLGEKPAIAIPAGLYAWGRLDGDPDMRQAGVLSAAAIVSSVLVVEGLKGICSRPRPVERLGESRVRIVGPRVADGQSFPSGHTATAFSWATVLSELYPRGSALYYGAAAGVGVGRVRVGAHYPSDVVAGALIGYLSGRLVLSNRNFIMRKETYSHGVATMPVSRTFRF